MREVEYHQLKQQDNWQKSLIELLQVELMLLHVERVKIEKGRKVSLIDII
ncbi:hypothetical protein JWV37_10710 [Sulfurospirillum sp. T05]|uniref:Uncharacterized protein n=1 Tax=Sulfurospirillum tamanense TaxID=2813362 RepID=A0ABS2WUB6_9BACT|nr:hypothetical protein [Sulfurospirillum tamanensis]MBN2965253.1 hypothetical protein [Sulfurospirillum tamanensis]